MRDERGGRVGEAPKTAAVDGDDVRARLSALTTLMFLTPPTHRAHAQAQRLDADLAPVRECAKAALALEPRDGPATEDARAALVHCWQLIDEVAPVIDRAGWWLRPGCSTRGWAQCRVDTVVRPRRKYTSEKDLRTH
jgi:hypothetical protein